MAAPHESIDRLGVVRDEKTGELIIPASQRPDGTWRKARRVKDGYVPQEEVPVYESKGMQFVKSIPDYPIGLAQEDIEKMRKLKSQGAGEDNATAAKAMSKAAKKNAKRKEKKKQQTANPDSSTCEVNKTAAGLAKLKVNSEPPATAVEAAATPSEKPLAQEEIAKKIKNLKKKVRQIEDLEAKISSGELKNPEKDQLEKIKKKQSLLEEIEDLELDLDDD